MNKSPKPNLPVDVYVKASEALYGVSGMVLFGFGKNEYSTKDRILRNFVAKSAVSLKSIFALWELSDYQSAWVIHRTVLDRLFHLHSIGKNGEYDIFDDWSVYQQYKAQNRVKSDNAFKHQAVGWVYELSDEQKARMELLSKNKPVWRRPNAESVAKDMGMSFLYKYGYDYASKSVHPMSDDGQQEFYAITGLEPAPHFPSQISVLSNSILASTMILNEAINQSSFRWHKILWDFLEQMQNMLDAGDESYNLSFAKLGTIFHSDSLCKHMNVE
ncbi:DUF5677 domain-containing protein [Desulfobacula sp.]|uniref:DUF5677 domain-containing protein n=1 Tax=Desulfobacula sp. TaxID=2593537 RepID=UPI0025BE85CA|nr:DUF5677 domain-containing protein [Desulfobacula sp.]MBC2704864.1 hypothetical protein [Desulfobacula sp.]